MNCNRLKLVLPSNEDKERVMKYKKTFLENDESLKLALIKCKELKINRVLIIR